MDTELAKRFGKALRIIENIRVRIDRLAVARRLNDRVDAQEPAQVVIVAPPVHVNELPGVEVLMVGEASVRDIRVQLRRVLVAPVGVPRFAERIVGPGFGQ